MTDEVPPETAEAPAEGEEPPAEGGDAAEGAEGAEGEEAKPEDADAEGDEKKEEGEAGDGAAGSKEPPDTGVGERIKKDPHELDFLVPLPEKVEFHMIPKINDARSVWRIGMRKLEETFAEHIANMHLDFEEKA